MRSHSKNSKAFSWQTKGRVQKNLNKTIFWAENRTADCKTLTNLLCLTLVRPLTLIVYSGKVWYNDGHWQCDDQHTGKGAHSTDNFPHDCFRYHVTVTDHGERLKRMWKNNNYFQVLVYKWKIFFLFIVSRNHIEDLNASVFRNQLRLLECEKPRQNLGPVKWFVYKILCTHFSQYQCTGCKFQMKRNLRTTVTGWGLGLFFRASQS